MTNESGFKLGRRIVVWGVTGSGKTTLGHKLGTALGLGVIELDAIAHVRGWDTATEEEFIGRLTESLDKLDEKDDGWVLEGSYSRIQPHYLPRADTLIWIHLPWRVSYWRLLKRTLKRSVTREEIYAGSPARESLRLAFFSSKSILWWGLGHHRDAERSRQRRTAELRGKLRIVELRSAGEVDELLATLEPHAAART